MEHLSLKIFRAKIENLNAKKNKPVETIEEVAQPLQEEQLQEAKGKEQKVNTMVTEGAMNQGGDGNETIDVNKLAKAIESEIISKELPGVKIRPTKTGIYDIRYGQVKIDPKLLGVISNLISNVKVSIDAEHHVFDGNLIISYEYIYSIGSKEKQNIVTKYYNLPKSLKGFKEITTPKYS